MSKLVFLDVDDTILSPPYEAVKKVCEFFGKKVPPEEAFRNRSHIHFYDAFPDIFRSKTKMWLFAIAALPFGYFRSQKALNFNERQMGELLADERVYLLTRNPPSFTRWRIRRLAELFSVNVGDRYIACGPIFGRGSSKVDIMREIANSHNVPFSECLLIDDCPKNLREAAEAGINVALVRSTWNEAHAQAFKDEFNSFSLIGTTDIPSFSANFLGALIKQKSKRLYLVPPLTPKVVFRLLFYFLKRAAVYSESLPKISDVLPVFKGALRAFLYVDPNRKILTRLNGELSLPDNLSCMRVMSLNGELRCLPIPYDVQKNILETEPSEKVVVLREFVRKKLESFGYKFPIPALFHFTAYDRSIETRKVLSSAQVANAVTEYAVSHGVPEQAGWDLAKKYAEELVVARSYRNCLIGTKAVDIVMSRAFKTVKVNFNDKIRKLENDYFLVYSSVHRSYLDSGMLFAVLAKINNNFPFVVAADKMRKSWLGRFGARGGSFFVRRKFVDSIYAAVLGEQVKEIHATGRSLEIFLEGQRSRSGLTLPPKKGIASIIWKNLDSPLARKVAIVPVSFAYNKLPESEMLIRETHEERLKSGSVTLREVADMAIKSGKRKSKYARLRGFWRRLTNPPISECHINFGDPIILSKSSFSSESEDEAALQSYLNETMTAINSVTSIFPSSVLCMCLLGSENHHLSSAEAKKFLDMSRGLLNPYRFATQNVAALWGRDSRVCVDDFSRLPFVNRKFKRHRVTSSDILSLSDLDIDRSSYYRNNILHFFVLPSVLANVLIESKMGRIEELHRFLDRMFVSLTSKYFLPPIEDPLHYIDNLLAVLRLWSVIDVSDRTYTVNSESQNYSLLNTLARIGDDIVKEDLLEVFENLRRSFPRIEISAQVEVERQSRVVASSAVLLNISETGCFLSSDERLQVGDQVRLSFAGGGKPDCIGEVVRVMPDGAGVKFSGGARSAQMHNRSISQELVADDRRSSVRERIKESVSLSFQRRVQLKGIVRNISPSGALVFIDGSLEKDDKLALVLKSNGISIELDCVVNRASEGGVGIRFLSLSPQKNAELVLFIAKLSKEQDVEVYVEPIPGAVDLTGTATGRAG